MWLALPAALAHPGGHAGDGTAPHFFGQRVTVSFIDTLRINLVFEYPERRVLQEATRLSPEAAPNYAADTLNTLAASIRVRWNNAPLPLTRDPLPSPARRGDPGFLEFHLQFSSPLPSVPGTFTLSNGALPDEQNFYTTAVHLAPDLIVTRTSLASVREGLLHQSTHGAWTREESAREFSVALDNAGYWERGGAERTLPEAMRGLQSLSPPIWMLGALAVALGAPMFVWGLRR